MSERAAITGIGVVSPLGLTIEQTWSKLVARESGISDFAFHGCEAFPHKRCGAIANFEPGSSVANRKLLKLMNREAQLALAAAGDALKDSAIQGAYRPERIGLYVGTGLTSGDLESLIPVVENAVDESGCFSYSLLGTKALGKCNPLLSFKILPNMALSGISIEHNIKGPNLVYNPWPGNTAQAIIEALRAVESGEIDCALVGGCDSKCNYFGFLTLDNLGLLSHKGASLPFSPEADGMILSEGSAFMVLESVSSARKRKATIYAELCGGSCLTDSISMELFPDHTEPLEEVMRSALEDAEVNAKDIDIVFASADSHPIGDANERQALLNTFGGAQLRILALSHFTGEMIAAAPAFALCVCAYSFKQKQEFPFLLDGESGGPRSGREKKDIQIALVNAFALGNTKASVVVQKHFSNQW